MKGRSIVNSGKLIVDRAGEVADRMPPIPQEKMTEAQKKATADLNAGLRGVLRGPFVPLLRSPEYMTRLQKTGEYLRFNSSLPTKLNEFATILTERQLTQQYEFDEHAPLALKAGLNSEILKAVAEGRRREGMAA